MPPLPLGTTAAGHRIALTDADRRLHTHIVGASGRGKSKLMEHLIRCDVKARRGFCLIDPHGQLYDELVKWLTWNGMLERRPIILLDATNPDWRFAFNPLAEAGTTDLTYVVDSMVRVFAQVWGGEDMNQTPLLKRCLRSVLYVLAAKQQTLLEAADLTNEYDPDGIRAHLTADLPDSVFSKQWNRFNSMPERDFREQFSSTQNRLIEFIGSPVIRSILGQTGASLDLRRCMDEGAMILVNLAAKPPLTEDNAQLLGALLVNDLFLKARGRDKHTAKRHPFQVYIDECQLFVNSDIARILDEARKFGLHLTLANQHLAQLREKGERIYGSIMTNAQTKIIFGGLSSGDARELTEEIYCGEFNLEEQKLSVTRPMIVGYTRQIFQGGGSSTGVAISTGGGQSFNEDDDLLTRTANQAGSESRSDSTSWSEQLVPILEERPDGGFYTLEEQIYRHSAVMRGQPTQEAIVRRPMKPPVQIAVVDVPDPKTSDERAHAFQQKAFGQTAYILDQIEAEAKIAARQEQLRLAARGITGEDLDDPDSFLS